MARSRNSENWSNIILIGMAGSGKSTVGRLLATRLGLGFVDTDLFIEESTGKSLQDLVDDLGPGGLRRIEEDVLLSVDLQNHVIATGGSSVYSEKGMAHLVYSGICVLLDVPLNVLNARILNMATRGLVRHPGQSFGDLYHERQPLYDRYADLRISCGTRSAEDIAAEIVRLVAELPRYQN